MSNKRLQQQKKEMLCEWFQGHEKSINDKVYSKVYSCKSAHGPSLIKICFICVLLHNITHLFEPGSQLER